MPATQPLLRVEQVKRRLPSLWVTIAIWIRVSTALLGQESAEDAARQANAQEAESPGRGGSATVSAEEVLGIIRRRLVAQFDAYLTTPADYRDRVGRECHVFPEGDLFPYLYPAMAYVNLALEDPERTDHSVTQAGKLIDLAIPSVIRHVRPPGGRLERLSDYRQHAMYLGQLNLALGAYYLISDDNRYDTLHRKLSDLLHQALVEAKGRPLRSFPQYSWPFDTIPVLVSLDLYDARTSRPRSAQAVRAHLSWVRANATHPGLRLPYSRIDNATGRGRELPRGCDLSFRLCLLPQVDRAYAEQQYAQYLKHYWLDQGLLAGFAEWPGGTKRFEDMDSGPIIMGIGLGSTGLGLGATIAMDDKERLKRLTAELATLDLLRPLFVAAQQEATGKAAAKLRMIRLDAKHVTGFLFGDAMLFYCITWQPWTEEGAPATKPSSNEGR